MDDEFFNKYVTGNLFHLLQKHDVAIRRRIIIKTSFRAGTDSAKRYFIGHCS